MMKNDITMKCLFLTSILFCVALTEANHISSFSVCVRFLISHFDINDMLAVESRDTFEIWAFQPLGSPSDFDSLKLLEI